jgi:serine/threonine protein kinase
MISNKYRIIEQLGNGNFGTVFKGENVRTNEKVAIKLCSVNSAYNLLKNEAKVYQLIGNTNGFPQLKWFGVENDKQYLVINLLGYSLRDLKEKNGKLSEEFVANIGIQLISRLQLFHELGLIHCDIKPDNCVFGINNNCNLLYLIDFGFSKGYMETKNKHILMKKTSNIIGSLNYISLNVHKKYESSRRDDLESVCYVLIYLLDILSWERYNEPSVSNILKIISEKESIIGSENVPFFIRKMMENIRQLNFEETPDYLLLIRFITEHIQTKI